jgi:type IV secretory pathway protease TraF
MSRFGYVMATYFALLAAGGLAFFHPAPWLIWNATASTPTGLYTVRPVGQLRRLELVAARPPEPIASYLADGGFLPKGVLLLKHVMALPGQTVCRAGDASRNSYGFRSLPARCLRCGRSARRVGDCAAVQRPVRGALVVGTDAMIARRPPPLKPKDPLPRLGPMERALAQMSERKRADRWNIQQPTERGRDKRPQRAARSVCCFYWRFSSIQQCTVSARNVRATINMLLSPSFPHIA